MVELFETSASLSDKCIICKFLDGHGEREFQKEYVSTGTNPHRRFWSIKSQCDGHVFALGGVSCVDKSLWSYFR